MKKNKHIDSYFMEDTIYHNLLYCLTWKQKNSQKILNSEVLAKLTELLKECAELNNWTIHELKVQSDSVMLLIKLDPDICIDKVVKMFKKGSQKILRNEFASLKNFSWEADYCVQSEGTFNPDNIKKFLAENL
jgi:REP element-mobilizing transposase RayT